jgi:hypothetical protein
MQARIPEALFMDDDGEDASLLQVDQDKTATHRNIRLRALIGWALILFPWALIFVLLLVLVSRTTHHCSDPSQRLYSKFYSSRANSCTY